MWHLKVIQVIDPEVNWEMIYDFLLCISNNFSHSMLRYDKHPVRNSMTLIWSFNVIQSQFYKVNWKALYYLLCVSKKKLWSYDVPFMRDNMLNVLWPYIDLYILSKAKCLNVNWNIIWLYICYIETLAIACTVCDILKRHLEWFYTFHILGPDWFHTTEATWYNLFGHLFVSTE